MMSASRALWKSAGTSAGSVPDKFPAGLRVLVVDDDPICLMVIEKMLKQCNYEAIVCNRAETGLSMLRENKIVCDIVLSDVHMPDMDGFKLLEQIGLEMDLPVIMMSADEDSSVVMKGITHGACDYIIKPVRIEALKNIWQHVVRRQKHKWKEIEPLTSFDDVDQHQNVPEDVDHTSSGNERRSLRIAKRRTDEEEDEYEDPDESSSSKKPRIAWSVELHQQFVEAVNQLGLDKAVPKKILDLMNVPGLRRENVASHLQKYRIYLKRLIEPGDQGPVDSSFLDIFDPSYDLQALGVGGQRTGQRLATVLGRSNYARSPFPMRSIDQRNTFSFEDSRFRYGEVNSPNILHGNISTNMEPRPFMSLHQPQHHSFNRFNNQVMPMVGQGQIQSQHVFTNGMLANCLGSNVSGGGILSSYNMFNDPNPIRSELMGSRNMTYSDLLTCPSPLRMGPDNGNGTLDNQDDLLTALLNQPEDFGPQDNELEFDGYDLDDLPRAI